MGLMGLMELEPWSHLCDPLSYSIRSIVGIIPLFAVEVLEQSDIDRLPGFRKRMEWFLKHRPDLGRHIAYCDKSAGGEQANDARDGLDSGRLSATIARRDSPGDPLTAPPTAETMSGRAR
jgi:hypothetical protein